MHELRRTVTAIVVVALVTTAGCGFILGTEDAKFTASPATPSDDALADTGYEEIGVTEDRVEREFTAAGQSRTVNVTNQLAQYDRSVDLGPLGSQRAALFVAFASPEISVLDREFNPIEDMDNRDILARLESSYDSFSVGEQVDSRNVTMFGSDTAVDTFEGTAEMNGQQIDVYVDVTAVVNDGDDYVVAIGVYPRELPDEEERIDTLIAGLEH